MTQDSTGLRSSEDTKMEKQNSPTSMLTAASKDTLSCMGPAGERLKPWDIKGLTFKERLISFEKYVLDHLDEVTCPVHLCLGQEEVPCELVKYLQKEDWVFSTHRNHGHYLAKGGDLSRLWDEIRGLAS